MNQDLLRGYLTLARDFGLKHLKVQGDAHCEFEFASAGAPVDEAPVKNDPDERTRMDLADLLNVSAGQVRLPNFTTPAEE